MDLEHRRAVLERVSLGQFLARQLALLAHGDEPRVEEVGERPAEDEATRLDPDDQLDGFAAVGRRHHVHRLAKGAGILQKGGDVLEEDPLFGEVRHVADLLR